MYPRYRENELTTEVLSRINGKIELVDEQGKSLGIFTPYIRNGGLYLVPEWDEVEMERQRKLPTKPLKEILAKLEAR
jgi:hypothetical protein